jgi:hypothetical protein
MLLINGFSLVINKVILIVILMIGNFHCSQDCKTIMLDCKPNLIDEISGTSSSTSNSIYNCFETLNSDLNTSTYRSTDNFIAKKPNKEIISTLTSTQKTDDFKTSSFKVNQKNNVENSKFTLFFI